MRLVLARTLAWTLLLAGLLPRAAASRGCHSGLFDCALPLALPAAWREPASWGLHAARWSMLPMMATLAVMAPWCSDAFGLTTPQWAGIHLAAMLLPALVLHAVGLRLHSAAWATAAMVLGGLGLIGLSGWRGLMVMSACQSLAWGLAWFTQVDGAPAVRAAARPRLIDAVAPALLVVMLGVALAHAGPVAVEALQGALALMAAVGLAACAWRTPRVSASRP